MLVYLQNFTAKRVGSLTSHFLGVAELYVNLEVCFHSFWGILHI